MKFLSEDFLLKSENSRGLYHGYAEKKGIYDYHTHLSARDIAEDRRFANLTEAWLAGDHYKWRAMRTNGVDERYITGEANSYEKFEKWAATVPYTLRNPLYHWTHLELKRYFGIGDILLSGETAKGIYEKCGEMLRSREFSVRNLLRMMNVKVVCTTDDVTDGLEHHKRVKEDGFEITVLPTWRCDKAMQVEDIAALNVWIDRLEEVTGTEVKSYETYIEALRGRHDFFHAAGCRLSDVSGEAVSAEDYTEGEIKKIFKKIRTGGGVDEREAKKFKSAMMFELACMNAEKGWAQQLHLGVMRNVNTRMFEVCGADSGFDTMGDLGIARGLVKFLNRLEARGKLAKTIIYNLNPKDNEVIAAMIGSFQDGSAAGKLQMGPAWWFLDQRDGIKRQINAISNMGLLSRFVGMVTDSRSFLSFPRHEYFRRIVCDMLGGDMEKGRLPEDAGLVGRMVEDICYNNAANYFQMGVRA